LRRAFHATDLLLGGRGALGSMLEAPSETEVRTVVVPALAKALARAEDRDTITAAMIALAKIGVDPDGLRLHDLFRERLASHDQEVRESAALCIGIARQCKREDLELLMALCSDAPWGRRCTGRTSVDERTRAFATYALGLCLPRVDAGQRMAPVRCLTELLHAEGAAGIHRNVTVAAIAAIGQLPNEDNAASRTLVDTAAMELLAFYEQDLGPGSQLTQSHCPMALAQLLGRSHPRSDACRAKFAARLREEEASDLGPRSKTNDHVAQSCAAALGALCRPWDDDASADRASCEALVNAYRTARDHQTRYFAALSLGRIGGAKARSALLLEMREASRAIEQPWIMLALGTMVADRNAAALAAGKTPEPDLEIRDALLAAFRIAKNPQAIGSAAIALGLCRAPGSSDALRRSLSEYGKREDAGGQIAIGLALLEERGAAPQLRELLAGSVRQPQLLVRIATALGRLGDAEAVEQLTAMLESSDGGLARMSALASGLGQLGDRRCIAPLLQMLSNRELTPLTRAFAAVALGGVCDPEPMPWNARYAASVNYRAAVETLTDGAAGILDIL
jgi:HEAT repeat protein